ncbi:hypothetical protein F4814DRAFT_439266 [Daldinia grandis]|nr:hypothetical protein F4814DRAFT_439266 [Daldinia grandis]
MSTTSRRRNGSQASCERCRKAKIRCDRQKPIYAPCRRRGLESQCWYHPAPLAKHPLAFTEEITIQLRFLLFRQASLVPRPIILQLVASIRSSPITKGYTSEHNTTQCDDGLSRLAKVILCLPASEIPLKPNFDPEQFCELNLSLRIPRELSAQTNDIIRFGDLVTGLFALGLHREALYSVETVPFFLSECRRKNLVTAYYIDKAFALVFNRLPRILARHADCKLPLDLSEDELFATSPVVLDQARGRVSLDSWNTDGNYKTTTWARMRYILAGFREEIVDYQFRSVQSIDQSRLSSLLKHLIYNKDWWGKLNLPCAVCLMLGEVYLAYLHPIFQVHRLLQQGSGASHEPELIEVSKNMLETVVQMANAQSRVFCCPHSILTVRCHLNVGPGISGSVLIRNLSVLVSHLENATSSGESDISRNLNQTLSGFIASTATTPLDLDAISSGDFNSLDFEAWVMNVNLNAINSDWNIQ